MKTLQNILKYTGVAILTGSVSIIAAIYMLQNQLIYHPVIQGLGKSPSTNPRGFRSPSDLDLPYQNVTINTKDNLNLKGWMIYTQKPQKSRTIIYYHQNAGNIGTRLSLVRQLIKKTNSNVLLIAYRGYSDSEGSPNEKGIKIDGLQTLDWCINNKQIDNTKVYLYGRSLGGAVASYVAANSKYKNQIKGIILENTFFSMTEMVKKLFGKISFLLTIGLTNLWSTNQQIEKITNLPILFIKGQQDELVPKSHMDRLQAIAYQFNDKKPRNYNIRFGTHNEMWTLNPEQYFKQLNNFFAEQENQLQI